METETVTVHYHAGYNMVGYLPESEVGTFSDWVDAKADMLWTLNNHADNQESWSDKHDCDDIPCPTYGESCPYMLASSLTFEAEDLNLDNGPEWGTIVGNMSYWINECQEEECSREDDDF